MKNNTAIKFISLSILTAFLLAACSDNTLTVKTDYQAIPYGQLKTYRCYDLSLAERVSNVPAVVRKSIRTAINRELATKGLSIKGEGAVDFFVNFTVTAKDHVDIEDYLAYSGTAPGYSWNRETGFRKIEYTEQKTEYVHHRDGTLVIDIIDFSSDQLIWRGVAEQRLTSDLSDKQREKLINKAVSAVLADFPPKNSASTGKTGASQSCQACQ